MLQNPSTVSSSSAVVAANAATSVQPKVVVMRRRGNLGFGFTLRHFIAYSPEDVPAWPQEASESYQVKAMDTIFIKEVHANGPAHYANLQTGDRILMVNNQPIAGIAYSTVVAMIKQTPNVLTLHVVPKECDVLQMRYDYAHTPESNRMALTSATPASIAAANVLIGNSNNVAQAQNTFHSQQLISYAPTAAGATAVGGSNSRSGSITSNTSSGNMRPVINSSKSLEYANMPEGQHTMNATTLHMRADGAFIRSQPPNLTVLARQQHQQQQQQQQPITLQPSNCSTFYSPTNTANSSAGSDNTDLMIRLRESIKQKEEFLKSPLPHVHQANSSTPQHQTQAQHFFPHTPPGGSPQLSSTTARAQLRSPLVKQPLSASAIGSTTTNNSCDMQNYYARSVPTNFMSVDSALMSRNNAAGSSINSGELIKPSSYAQLSRSQRQTNIISSNSSNSSNNSQWDKYAKNLEYLETLQETGVTNKVFERKLVSHMAKGFDPFKPLSINTNAVEANALLLQKKQGVLYESLQQHPLHQMKLQQLQQVPYQTPKVHHIASSSSMVDGQMNSRMEIHKATLANTTVDTTLTPNKYSSTLSEQDNPKSPPTNNSPLPASINELEETAPISKAASDSVVRRLRSASSLDDNKPMRRISYLRATNNETDFQSEAATTNVASSSNSSSVNKSKEMLEEETEHTYDVVAVDETATADDASLDCISIENLTLNADEGRNSSSTPQPTVTAVRLSSEQQQQQQQQQHVLLLGNSRRGSVNCELRNSMHIEHLAELNGKLETKDVSTEMEVFETEMEIKSNSINGKRISEYRSWKQVKIEIKGDILKIYSSRSSKAENHLIELDIRNFTFSDETTDKKKFIFRMQSKPMAHLATLGNELSLDDTTSSTAAAAAGMEQQQQHQQQHTEILFKTKSITEMRRIFGLLQWKNSFIYDDCSDLQGRQLAEPQKTAASVTMPTATYCDENVQPQQQKQLSADYATRNAELEPPAIGDSISPVMKTRKSASSKNIPDKDLGSPKAKNWKDLLFRRGGGSSHSADISPSNLSAAAKTIGSIGVPLRACPMSKNNEYLPNLVDVCTNIVESKGLSVVGIYRIPGNKAAISELSEQVNKSDFSWERCNTDVRWEDVNVVSSLLKLFIRSLPDALLPSSFYTQFIEADKKQGLARLKELKDLLDSLPRHSYETMKHLIRHLNRVSKNSEVNLMDPRNLAIIFGPSIIRARNDSLEIAVKDMKHQCCIVELLLTQYDYFFEHAPLPELSELSGNAANNNSIVCTTVSAAAAQAAQEEQTNMLLHNVAKIERLTERENNSSSSTGNSTSTRTSRFIPQLRRKAHGKRGGAASSDTYSGESVLSLDYTKNTVLTTSTSSTNTNATTSSSSSSSTKLTSTSKKKEHGFLLHSKRAHHRKASLDEKDSGSGSGSGGSIGKEQQRSSVDISILLTDDESSNSRISDTGSMSLNTVTDTLDIKLRNLRSGSESNEENGSPELPNKNRRHTFGQPLHLHCENIPYADESPERLFHHVLPALDASSANRACNAAGPLPVENLKHEQLQKQKDERMLPLSIASYKTATMHKLQHSATAPPLNSSAPATIASTPTAVLTLKSSSNSAPVSIGISGGSARNSYTGTGKNLRFSNSVYAQQCCSEDDSEGSTTSDPKESLAPAFFLERYHKKRRERLFRSASFNCRNYQQRHAAAAQLSNAGSLTKDEKTDMNLTKKRQIQNKQNRSIKRRHTVGGTHDYSTNCAVIAGNASQSGVVNVSSKHCQQHGNCITTVLRRMPIPSANGNIVNNSMSAQQSDGNSNGNSSGSGSGSSGVEVDATEQVLEVGIRIKNIQRSRY